MNEPLHAPVDSLDDTRWNRLIAEHRDAVFRLAYLLLGDAHEAEDVAQDVFVRAFRAWERYDQNRPLRPWLLRITTNLVANRRRSLARAFAAFTRLGRETPEFAPDIALANQARHEAQELWRAVRQLRQTDQQIIYMRYFLDLPEADMAQALAIAAGTVKSRLHRALVRLRSRQCAPR